MEIFTDFYYYSLNIESMQGKIKSFIFDLIFPKFCLGCQREGDYLCPDCRATIEIFSSHQPLKTKHLQDLYFATDYQNFLLKRLIQKFKYFPFLKELAPLASSLIIDHLQLIDNPPEFFKEKKDYLLIPIPLTKKRLKWRGFNQAEEIAKHLGEFLNLPVLNNVLLKKKSSLPQVELSERERKENVKGSFFFQNEKLIRGKKVILVDDIYTTGATMEEAAKILKEAGAKEIIGMVVAKAKAGSDRI